MPKSWANLESARWTELIEALRPEIAAAASLEAAAQVACARICAELDTTVLARVYAILAYRDLPADVRAFVDDLAAKTGQSSAILPGTRVLTLLGTHGRQPEWRDRRSSRGHKAIPLVSADFVEGIPMLARLLKEIGVDLSWLDHAPDATTAKLTGGINGIFYAEDARTTRDAKGRLVIPAIDFVKTEDVKTVFGMGGSNADGSILTCIVFTRERLSRARVERLSPFLTMLKGETFRAVLERRFFNA